jgi:hypothetical protein
MLGESGIVEQPDQHSRKHRKHQRRQQADAGVEDDDVADNRALAVAFARQEVESAHAETERKHGDGAGHDEEHLLVETEVLQAEPSHEHERQCDGECESDRLGNEQPHRLRSQ